MANPTTFYWERQASVLHRDKNNKNQVILSLMCKGSRPLGTKYFLRLYPCSIDKFHTEQHNGGLSALYAGISPSNLATNWMGEVFHRANSLPESVGICHLPVIYFQERRHELGTVQITNYACWLVPSCQAGEALGRLSSVKRLECQFPGQLLRSHVDYVCVCVCVLEKDE